MLRNGNRQGEGAKHQQERYTQTSTYGDSAFQRKGQGGGYMTAIFQGRNKYKGSTIGQGLILGVSPQESFFCIL